MPVPSRRNTKRYLLAFGATVGMFALWGFAHRVFGMVVTPFYSFFGFTEPQSFLTSSSYNFTYLAIAIPAALFMRSLGYKLALVLGLSAYSLGAFLFYPAVAQHQPLYFVCAVIATGTGWAFLETAANPLICRMGRPETAVLRLNVAQTFYPFGLLIAAFLGRWIGAADARIHIHNVETFVRPYVVVGLVLLLLAFFIENLEFPRVASERVDNATKARREFLALLSLTSFRISLLAMAASMAGLVCVMAVLSQYTRHAWLDFPVATLADLNIATWIVLGIGRIGGAALMTRFNPMRLLAIAVATTAVLICAAQIVHGPAGVVCLVSTYLFMSIMFPTIFADAIRDAGNLTKTASGLLVAAAGTGAFLATIVMRWMLMGENIHLALTLAAICLAVTFVLVLAGLKHYRAVETAVPADIVPLNQ